jgi:aldehyde:ferredoxin oxidoreductase
MVDTLWKMVKREGFGDVLADGVKIAAQKIGKGSIKYAIHIGGQEPGMHDPKGGFAAFAGRPMGAVYQMDATPGRHTAGFGPDGYMGWFLNAAGVCMHGNIAGNPTKYLEGFTRAVTGWDVTMKDLLLAGERIGTMRHLFTLREGDNPLQRDVPGRFLGRPPFAEGPQAGVTVDLEAQDYWALGYMDWDRITTKPTKQKLLALGLTQEAEELWPDTK